MVVPFEAYGRGGTYLTDNLNTWTGLADAETLSGKYLLIAACMQFRETGAELELLPVYHNGTVSTFLALHGILRQVVRVDTQEVAHSGLLQSKITGHPVMTFHMHYVLAHRSEYPLQHVVEMHADVRGHSPALVLVALP